MDLINLSWHLGAFLFGIWGLWLLVDSKRNVAEVTQSLLPILLDAGVSREMNPVKVPKSMFVRAVCYLLVHELQPLCPARLRFGKLGYCEGSDLGVISPPQALQALYSLKKMMSGGDEPIAGDFVVKCNGVPMTLLEFYRTNLSHFDGRTSVTFSFMLEEQTHKGMWNIRSQESAS